MEVSVLGCGAFMVLIMDLTCVVYEKNNWLLLVGDQQRLFWFCVMGSF